MQKQGYVTAFGCKVSAFCNAADRWGWRMEKL